MSVPVAGPPVALLLLFFFTQISDITLNKGVENIASNYAVSAAEKETKKRRAKCTVRR